jgi:hypothetical protein
MIVITKKAKIATGASHPTQWEQMPGNAGIYVDVDTSVAGFTKTPTYLTAHHGVTSHWRAVGGSSAYHATPTKFRVYIRLVGGGPLTVEFARERSWHIQWIGIED